MNEERVISPIGLNDGTMLFMYYKYPLRQAFGDVLAEPIVTLDEGGEYRVRYVARDGEGRDRLEGARPIVTRDWKRSKWLNEFLVGLDELRLMASLGGRGGPENELYRILSGATYRAQLACYASKFPDESGSRLIILNWVGPLAEPSTAKMMPARPEPRTTVVLPGTPQVKVERHAVQQAKVRRAVTDQPTAVIPLAHQVTADPPAPSPGSHRERVAPDAAPRATGQESVEDAGPKKLKIGFDSTQPVPVQSAAAQPVPVEQPVAPHDAGPSGHPAPIEPSATQQGAVVRPVGHQRPIERPGASRDAGRSGRRSTAGRQSAAGTGPVPFRPSWVTVAGAVVFGFCLMMAGWWLRGAPAQPSVASSPPESPVAGPEIVTAGVAAPDPAVQEADAEESPAQSESSPGSETARPTAAAGGEREPPGDVREEVVEVARNSAPAAPPDRQPSPPGPAAINTPLLAQGGKVAGSAPPINVQSRGEIVRDEPPVEAVTAPPVATSIVQRQVPPVEDAPAGERPRRAQVLAQESDTTLKISSEQMSAEQRHYLARVIRWLEPPLRYEWIPKYTRPAFFASLVTAGEPPECRIDFNGPTVITFDLVIRGGNGTESRLEDVEIIYRQ